VTGWQKVIYGDTKEAREALSYWRDRGWPVDSNTFPEREECETRVYAFISGWLAAKRDERERR
jgi:hypothetical protein